jgi:hypothetical protein
LMFIRYRRASRWLQFTMLQQQRGRRSNDQTHYPCCFC